MRRSAPRSWQPLPPFRFGPKRRKRPSPDELPGSAAWSAAQALAADPADILARSNRAVDDSDFWSARPILADLCEFARARRVGPWAMFGALLVKVLASVPPFIVLPGQVGSEASLNMFVALVGASAGGKGAAERAANAFAIGLTPIKTVNAGSGEGLVKLFAVMRKRPRRRQ